MPDLSILCMTKAEKPVLPLLGALSTAAHYTGAELILVADGRDAFASLVYRRTREDDYSIFQVQSKGYIESVLDSCINLTTGRYVFRVDDDETLSPPLVEWLRDGGYKESDHWKFNRAHLIRGEGIPCYPNIPENRFITSPPLWPDHQTRLSTREKSFGRTHIHCGSPHGGGDLCPYPIIHHKFLIKSREEREEIMKRYEGVQPGAGSGFRHFSVPELIEEEGGKIETISYEQFVQRGYAV